MRRALKPLSSRTWISYVLFLGLALRVLVPSGFMPDAAAAGDGIFKIVICTAVGFKTIAIDPVTGETQETATGHAGEPCAFTGLAMPVGPHETGVELPAPHAVRIGLGPVEHGLLPPVRAGPVLGSRGPPSLV